MDTREALEVIEQLDPHPAVLEVRVRNWPLAIIRAAANAERQAQNRDTVMHDRLMEALQALTGIPYSELLSPEVAAMAADTDYAKGQ
jgi:phage portal protein BeeE